MQISLKGDKKSRLFVWRLLLDTIKISLKIARKVLDLDFYYFLYRLFYFIIISNLLILITYLIICNNKYEKYEKKNKKN